MTQERLKLKLEKLGLEGIRYDITPFSADLHFSYPRFDAQGVVSLDKVAVEHPEAAAAEIHNYILSQVLIPRAKGHNG